MKIILLFANVRNFKKVRNIDSIMMTIDWKRSVKGYLIPSVGQLSYKNMFIMKIESKILTTNFYFANGSVQSVVSFFNCAYFNTRMEPFLVLLVKNYIVEVIFTVIEV